MPFFNDFFLLLHLHLPLLPLQLHLVWFIFSVCSCCFETETHLLSNLITFCSDFFPSIWPQKTKQKQQKKTFFFHWKWKIFPANFTVCCAIAFFCTLFSSFVVCLESCLLLAVQFACLISWFVQITVYNVITTRKPLFSCGPSTMGNNKKLYAWSGQRNTNA